MISAQDGFTNFTKWNPEQHSDAVKLERVDLHSLPVESTIIRVMV